ncbi:MAG: CYTH domain-containing protein [Patescibacteria group bacterium]|nr:MAG: CYTH domain-containing protein [Patescibacteria group bacterium]
MIRLSRTRALSVIVPEILKLRGEKPDDAPVRVAIVGASASGKGHLIQELVEHLLDVTGRKTSVGILALDNYYRGRKEMAARRVPHFDHPDAVELSLAGKHLSEMRVGQRLSIPCYDFPRGERVGLESFTVRPIVLIDGLFGLAEEIRQHVDYGVYIDTDVHSAMLRRLFRDAGPNGRTKQSSSAVLAQYFREVVPSMHAFIAPTAAHADVLVESRYDAAVEAAHAGAFQAQCKARGHVDDDGFLVLAGAQRLGGASRQIDTFLVPKSRAVKGEMLRVREENGAKFLTYKGPLIEGVPGIAARNVTLPIEIDDETHRRLRDDYEIVCGFAKLRTLFHAGSLVIARDSINPLGNFIEVRVPDEHGAPQAHETLKRLGLREPYITESYFDLWQKAVSDGLKAHQPGA